MNILGIVIKLLPFIVQLMQIAEKAAPGEMPETGAEKKELVTEGVKAVVEAVETVSTGGQAETWGLIGKVVDPFIDAVCSIFNVFGIFRK